VPRVHVYRAAEKKKSKLTMVAGPCVQNQ